MTVFLFVYVSAFITVIRNGRYFYTDTALISIWTNQRKRVGRISTCNLRHLGYHTPGTHRGAKKGLPDSVRGYSSNLGLSQAQLWNCFLWVFCEQGDSVCYSSRFHPVEDEKKKRQVDRNIENRENMFSEVLFIFVWSFVKWSLIDYEDEKWWHV